MAVSTNNGLVNGLVHNLLLQFFTLGSSKMEVFETCFHYIVTTQHDDRQYGKYILGRIYAFFTLFGCWAHGGRGGGSPKGLVRNLMMQFFPLDSSKIEVLET